MSWDDWGSQVFSWPRALPTGGRKQLHDLFSIALTVKKKKTVTVQRWKVIFSLWHHVNWLIYMNRRVFLRKYSTENYLIQEPCPMHYSQFRWQNNRGRQPTEPVSRLAHRAASSKRWHCEDGGCNGVELQTKRAPTADLRACVMTTVPVGPGRSKTRRRNTRVLAKLCSSQSSSRDDSLLLCSASRATSANGTLAVLASQAASQRWATTT